MILAMVPAARAQEASVVQLHGHDTDAFDLFGSAVALDGDLALVGAFGADAFPDLPFDGGGAAYVFRYTGDGPFDGWEEESRLVPTYSFEQSGDFGEAVSFLGAEEPKGGVGLALVGARRESLVQDPNPNPNTGREGAAYIFRRGNDAWVLEAKLLPAGVRAFDHTGESVSLAHAPPEGSGHPDPGAVYAAASSGGDVVLWRRDPVAASDSAEVGLDTVWTEEQRIDDRAAASASAPGPRAAGEGLGAALAVGAPGRVVEVWRRTAEDADAPWAVEASISGAAVGSAEPFGSFALAGDVLAVGAPNSGTWPPAPGGAVYVFGYTGAGPFGGWALEAELTPSDPEAAWVGRSVRLSRSDGGNDGGSGAGRTLLAVQVVGLPQFFVFERTPEAEWVEVGSFGDNDVFPSLPSTWDLSASSGSSPVRLLIGNESVDERGNDAGVAFVVEPVVHPVASDLEAGASSFGLGAPYPSPARAGQAVRLAYTLAEAGPVRLVVYDVLGRPVAVVDEGSQGAGAHEAVFATGGLAGGVYLVVLEADGERRTWKLLVVR